MKNFCMLIVVCFSTTLFIIAEAYPDIIWTPQYNYHGEIIEEKVSDIPVKCQVDLDVLVSEEVTEKVLTDILNALYKQAQGKSGFKYHKHPTHIAIFAYVSKEHRELGKWIGMLSQVGLGKKPSITISIPKKQPTPLNDSREILGRWVRYGPVSGIIAIYRQGGKLYFEEIFNDGSKFLREVIKRQTNAGTRFDYIESVPTGDHHLLNKAGDLENRDNDGLIDTAKIMK